MVQTEQVSNDTDGLKKLTVESPSCPVKNPKNFKSLSTDSENVTPFRVNPSEKMSPHCFCPAGH